MYFTSKWQKELGCDKNEKADPSSSANLPKITTNLENELGKEYRVNFAARKPEMVANFGSVLKMFRKIEGKENSKEKSPKSEENVKKEEILSTEGRKIPKSVKTPRKCLVKPKNASSGSKNRHGFTGSGLGSNHRGS